MIAILLLLSFVLEALLLGFFSSSKIRIILAYAVAGTLVPLIVLLCVSATPITFLLAVFSVYRLINVARVVKGRMHEHYLRTAVTKTSLALLLLQLVASLLIVLSGEITLNTSLFLEYIAVTLMIISGGMFFSLLRTLQKSKWQPHHTYYSDKELPTVSVAIPARNETEDLTACLESIIANDYPKLEILVLDDCSHDKTAEIIKGFAHAGVRFIQGDEPNERWLAKNQAYDKLYRESNGEYLLFCGVDVRFGPGAIKSLVTIALNRKKSMVSVLPLRYYPRLDSAFIQPMRYWWELVPPRRLFNRPPALSTCWLIARKSLKKQGGFAALSRAIIPESHIARSLAKTDEYSFMVANKNLEVQTVKHLNAQKETAIRVRYPQVKKSPEAVAFLLITELCLLIGPYALLTYALLQGSINLALPSAIACGLLTLTHIKIMQLTNPGNVAIALVNFPLVVLTELFILHQSMFKYEFGTVIWKERNVCIPAMHVVPHLPSIDK